MIYKVFSEKVMQILPRDLHVVLDYITSPGVVIPTLVLMILVIYNLISTSGLLKDANEDLKEQVCLLLKSRLDRYRLLIFYVELH